MVIIQTFGNGLLNSQDALICIIVSIEVSSQIMIDIAGEGILIWGTGQQDGQ